MNSLVNKINSLITLAQQQKSRVAELEKLLEEEREKLNNQSALIENQKLEINNFQNQLKIATLAGRLEHLDSNDKATLKKQISELIKEIDQCVNFLETV